MTLRRIIYISTSVDPVTEEDLLRLADLSSEKNRTAAVTGLLLFAEGHFLQLLEGPDEAVGPLYEKIKRDRRHRDVIRMLDDSFQERLFPNWHMRARWSDGPMHDSISYIEDGERVDLIPREKAGVERVYFQSFLSRLFDRQREG